MKFEMIFFARIRGFLSCILPAVILAILLLSACQPSIQILPSSTDALPRVATVAPLAHSLSIAGVDFDPPLDDPQILSGCGVRLLVAIENRGQYHESDVQVMAQLLDPLDRTGAGLLLNETITIEALETGEIRLVSFSPVTTLPMRSRYKLVVTLFTAHAAREELQDNSRVYDIVLDAVQ